MSTMSAVTSIAESNRPLSRIRSGRSQNNMTSQTDQSASKVFARDSGLIKSAVLPSKLPDIHRRTSTGALLDGKQTDRRSSFNVVFDPQLELRPNENVHNRPSTTDNRPKPRGILPPKSLSQNDVSCRLSGSPANDMTLSEETVPVSESPTSPSSKEDFNNDTDELRSAKPEMKSNKTGTSENSPEKNPPRLLERFDSSGDFKAVLKSLYGKKDVKISGAHSESWLRIKRMANLSSGLGSGTKPTTVGQPLTLRQKEEKAAKLKAAAARGWRIIRRYVEDRKFEKHTSGASMGWAVLKHHLTNMSDVNTRRDLYQRYGIVPTKQSDGSYKTTNVMRVKTNRFKTAGTKGNSKPPKCSRENTQISLKQLKIL